MLEEPSDKEIEYVVNNFISYMETIIPNIAINFAKKYKKQIAREIPLSDNVLQVSINDTKISLHSEFKIKYLEDDIIKKYVLELNDKEKVILEDMINKVPLKITASKLETTTNYIKKLRGVVKKKLSSSLKGEKNGR